MKIVQLNDIAGEAVSHDADIVKRVLLGELDLPGSVRLSHALLSPGQKAAGHSHENICEVFYVLSGQGLMTVNAVDYPLRQGSCLKIDKGELHELGNTGEADMAVIYFALNC